MQEIVNFLTQNWQFISAGLVLVFEIIILIVKKRPVNIRTVLQDEEAYQKIIAFIQEAEKKFGDGHGSEKLDFVITKFLSHEGISDQRWYWEQPLKDTIESILKTPQKKKIK